MLRDFVAWLDDYLASRGPGAAVKAAIGLLSFAALLGALVGNAAIEAGLMSSVLLLVLSMMVILLRDRRRLLSRVDEHEAFLASYCHEAITSRKPPLRLLSVDHVAVVEPNGDVREVLTMRVVALEQDLDFIPHVAGPGWAQPPAQLRKVTVEVRGISVDGKSGTRWSLLQSWRDGKLTVLAQLNSPAPVGGVVALEMARSWPGKCLPLMRQGRPETFTYDYSRPVDHLRYVVVLPRRVDAFCEPIGFTEGTPGFSLEKGHDPDGRTRVTLAAENVPADHRFGMRLECRSGDRIPLQVH